MRPTGVPDWVCYGSIVTLRGETFPWRIAEIHVNDTPRVVLEAKEPIQDPDLYYRPPTLSLRELIAACVPVPENAPDLRAQGLFLGQTYMHPERHTRWYISSIFMVDGQDLCVSLRWADPLPQYVGAYDRTLKVEDLQKWGNAVSWHQLTLDAIALEVGTQEVAPPPAPEPEEAAETNRYDLLTGGHPFLV